MYIKRKKPQPVSRVLSLARSIIYLGRQSPAVSINLPPGNGRVSPWLPVYLVFQPIRLAITRIAASRRELLPRVFTLTCSGTVPCYRRRYFFCGALCCPLRDTFLLGSMGPCVARTFLPPLAWPAIEQSRHFSECKGTLICWKLKIESWKFFVWLWFLVCYNWRLFYRLAVFFCQ